MTTSTALRTNRYAGRCVNCAAWVPAEAGVTRRSALGRWEVLHAECPSYAGVHGRHALPYDSRLDFAGDPAGAYLPRHRAEDAAAPAPVAAAVPAHAAEGFYVRGDETFRVVANKAGTRTYAKRLAVYGDRLSWDYAPGVGRDLAAEGLTPLTSEQAGRLGLLHGRCINCFRSLGGTSLSAQVSALIGYGETCAGHNGWTYPTGAAAQRAYIATH